MTVDDDAQERLETVVTVSVTPRPTGVFRDMREDEKERRENVREEIKELREDAREERKENREEVREGQKEAKTTVAEQKKTMWTEMKRRQVGLITQRIQDELNIRYKIILKLKEKIGERITKKAETHEMSRAAAKLEEFDVSQYEADMVVLKTKLDEISESETPKMLLPEVRGLANKARISLRSMHQFLVEVMKLIATAPKR